MLKRMIASGYADARTIDRRIKAMEAWLADPQLLKADDDAEYAAVIEIDLADITRADRWPARTTRTTSRPSSDVAGAKIDEVFIGSCMTNIGHFRAASKLLGEQARHPGQAVDGAADQDGCQAAERRRATTAYWVPPARAWKCRGAACAWATRPKCKRARRCSRPRPATSPTGWARTAMFTWAAAELAAICSKLGRIPTKAEYMADMGVLTAASAQVYQYLNFDRVPDYARGCGVSVPA